ncbi:MAG: DUF3592 domain-containing protein [Henriciella sp.]
MFARIVFRLFGLGCLAAGLYVINLGLKERARFVAVEKSSERVVGIVAGYEDLEYAFHEDRGKYHPVIQYETPEGDVRRFKAQVRAKRSAYPIGEVVDVLAAPCPTGEDCAAELTDGTTRFMRKWFALLFGGAFFLVGAFLVWKPPSEFGDGHQGGGGPL